MGTAKVVLRQGRARPLWFGHPWVYANGVARVEGDPAPGDVVALCDHDGRFIGQGFYNPRSQIPVRLCTRTDGPVDAAFFRARIAGARAARARLGPAVGADQRLPPRQQRGGRPARAGGRRLRRRRGRSDHHAGDLRPAQRDLRRAGGGAGQQDDLRDLARLVRRAGRLRRRLARRARRAAHQRVGRRGRHQAGGRAALRTEDRDVHRPARDARSRRGAGQRRPGARSLRLRRRLLAGRRPRRRQGGHRRRQLGPRRRPNAGPRRQERRQARSRRGRRLPLPRDGHARALSICWSSTRPSSRAPARIWRPPARATSG